MNRWRAIGAIVWADFLERTRRSSFLVILCLVIYLGYAVNTGQVLIKLEVYRGIYNSAWVGSLMALVITFFLGVAGFYLVKNAIERDERSGVGQIIATTPLSGGQYLLGKWLSNFLVLASLVGLLALAALLMQILQREAVQVQVWALTAPFLFIALPMMALVAALAVFFETVPWLKGGFGNLVYFGVFTALFMAGIFLTAAPWLDATGVSLVGASMKAAARAAFPDYRNGLTLAMVSAQPLQTFVWQGLDWRLGLILQRLAWLAVSLGVVLCGSLFFSRFDPSRRSFARNKAVEEQDVPEEEVLPHGELPVARLTPLPAARRFRFNFGRLAWLETLLLVKGQKWYWWAGLAGLWLGCIFAPSEALRRYWFMLVSIWPVLVWARMGEREARCHTEQLVNQAPYPHLRLLGAAWLAGVTFTGLAFSGVLLGRLVAARPLSLLPWVLSVLFVPALALTLGTWSRSSKLFEVVYPILWYLGPFNRENGLAVLDYLGLHAGAPVNLTPLLFAGLLLMLWLLAFAGRRLQAAPA